MTLFDDREKAFEAKYRMDQETDFKITVRRDKLLGLWAAGRMGLEGDAAKAYALTVVDAEFTEPDHDATHKVQRDLAAKGVELDEVEFARQVALLREEARSQIIAEYKK
ncbi:MAG: DUF1476 domain-containing protein [Pseudomonadota bacterium]